MIAWYEKDTGPTSLFSEWRLSGERAIAKKGEAVVVRFLPHPSAGKLISERGDKLSMQEYVSMVESPVCECGMHWYTTHFKNTRRALCPSGLDGNSSASCQFCTDGVRRQRVFAINAILLDRAGSAVLNDNGEVDVRIMFLSRRMFDDLRGIMTGPFSVGDITHPLAGRSIAMKRPQTQFEPWRLVAESSPSPIPLGKKCTLNDILRFVMSLKDPKLIISSAAPKDYAQALESYDAEATSQAERTRQLLQQPVAPPQQLHSRQHTQAFRPNRIDHGDENLRLDSSQGNVAIDLDDKGAIMFPPGDDD